MVLGASVSMVPQRPRHPEVDQEYTTATKPKNQILAASLLQAHDADGVVDRVVLGDAPGPEVHRRQPDRERAEASDVAVPLGRDGPDDGCLREHVVRRIASLRPNPAVVSLERGPV